MALSLKNLRALSEGTMSLDEVTKFQKYGLYDGADAKELSALMREARSEDDEKKRKKLWGEALAKAKELKRQAGRIPDNDFGDWCIDLFIKPWWWFLADIISVSAKGDSLTDMSRSQATSHFDQLIKQIEREMKD